MAHQLTLNSTSLEELKTLAAALPDEKKIQESKSVTPTTTAQTVTPDSGYDGLAKVTVGAMAAGSVGTPSISVSSSGVITATAAVTAGYVNGDDKTGTKNLTVQAGKTVTPTKSAQTAVASGRYTTGAVTVAAIPSQYITTTDASAAADDIVTGETAYVNGVKVTGTNPYEKAATDTEVATQATQIEEIMGLLDGKSVPGGGAALETCIVTMPDYGNISYITLDEANKLTPMINTHPGYAVPFSVVKGTYIHIQMPTDYFVDCGEGATVVYQDRYGALISISATAPQNINIDYGLG